VTVTALLLLLKEAGKWLLNPKNWLYVRLHLWDVLYHSSKEGKKYFHTPSTPGGVEGTWLDQPRVLVWSASTCCCGDSGTGGGTAAGLAASTRPQLLACMMFHSLW